MVYGDSQFRMIDCDVPVCSAQCRKFGTLKVHLDETDWLDDSVIEPRHFDGRIAALNDPAR